MQKNHYFALALVSLGIFLFGCGSDPAPNAEAGSSPVTAAIAGNSGLPNAGGPAVTGSGGTSSPTTGKNTGAGGKGTAGKGNAKAGTGGKSAAAGKAGTGPKTGSGGTTPANDGGKPAPVDTPFMWGLGVGITDIPAATKFYTEIMGMVVEKEGVTRDVGKPEERTETVLYAAEAKRGSRLVLMKYKDGRNTEKISAKLVWNVPNGNAVIAAAAAAGYATIYNMGGINAQIYGPDTYTLEFTAGMDSGGTGITTPYLIAVGFAITNMNDSTQFFADAFGMTSSPIGSFPITDATGAGTITESSVVYPTGGGAGLVLQTWVSTPPRNTKDNPVKMVTFVPNAQASADKLVAAGGKIVVPAKREPIYDNRLVIEAKDLDGYWIEIVE